jgi:hypothetical protein
MDGAIVLCKRLDREGEIRKQQLKVKEDGNQRAKSSAKLASLDRWPYRIGDANVQDIE